MLNPELKSESAIDIFSYNGHFSSVAIYHREMRQFELLTAAEEIALSQAMGRGMMALWILTLYGREPSPADLGFTGGQIEFKATVPEQDAQTYKRDWGLTNHLNVKIEEELAGTQKVRIATGISFAHPQAAERTIDVVRLINDLKAGIAARNHLVAANLRLVVGLAKKKLGNGLWLDDMEQNGNFGLLSAAEKYNYTLGYQFSTYAVGWIRQKLSRSIHNQARNMRLPVHIGEGIKSMENVRQRLTQELGRNPKEEELAEELGISMGKLLALDRARRIGITSSIGRQAKEDDADGFEYSDDPSDPDANTEDEGIQNVTRAELRAKLPEVLAYLSERERVVVWKYHGLDMTLQEIGDSMGISRERARQIEAKGMAKLRTRAAGLRKYLK